MRNENACLVEELRKKIVGVLVCGPMVDESENLENKTWWPKMGERRQIDLFFVLESSEESAVGVEGRREMISRRMTVD